MKDNSRAMETGITNLSISLPGRKIQILNKVTGLVVAWVVPLPSCATKHFLFLLGLDPFSAGSDATTRDAMLDEPVVIAAPIEWDEGVVQSLAFVPIDIEIPQLLRPDGIGLVRRVVDLVGVVWRRQHVVIHEEADLAVFFGRENRDVVI